VATEPHQGAGQAGGVVLHLEPRPVVGLYLDDTSRLWELE
jgi:hypothetical protein